MNNPFAGNAAPVKRRRNLVGREDALALLEEKVRKRQNTVIMGPEGIGKTSLLNCFFNKDMRLRLAREENILVARTDFPVHLPPDDVYHYLTEAIVSAIDILMDIDMPRAENLIRKVDAKRKCETGASRLKETCAVLENEEYDIALVIDDFENFTSSKSIQMEHHATMRHLIRSHYATYIVATNYDFEKDSLPEAVSGSFLLMEFSKNELPLDGFNLEQCRNFLEAQGAEGCFTMEEIAEMRRMSGGIPALLRITAEAAWDRKQINPVLDDAAWDAIQDRLYYDEQVRQYMNQWCRVLTANQIDVINSLLDEENELGVIRGENGPKAASALHTRRILIPRYRDDVVLPDCYEFNSILLQDYCNNTSLTASDPHDVQKYNITRQLKQMIEDGESAAVLSLLQEICGAMDNVTMPFDFDEPLTNELLQQFALNEEVLHSFSEDVQELITNGIRVERTFLQVQMKDYAPVYISFAKAIETHLNRTVVPVLKKIAPNYMVTNTQRLKNYKKGMMLGPINLVLKSSNEGLHTTFFKDAEKYCAEQGHPAYNEKWWKDLQQDLEQIKDIRNDIPHTAPLSGENGIKLLQMLFSGSNAFLTRCSELGEALGAAVKQPAKEQPKPKPQPQIQAGSILNGTVKWVVSNAAIVDLGAGKDGRLHISEIRNGYISDIKAELSQGQKLRVKVLSVDATTGKVELSMRNVPQT